MKRSSVLYSACLGAFVSMACSQAAPRLVGAGGGAPAPEGGSGGTAVVATGGSAGTPTVTGGAPAAGGSTTQAGGSGGAPASTGGSGGAPASTGGSGGQPGAAGSSATGGSASGGAGGGIPIDDLIPGLQSYYWEGTCAGTISVEGHNCPMSDMSSSCPTNGINREKSLAVKGVAGQLYTINIEVRGVIGTRCYTGGTRASMDSLSETGNNNWWYKGGSYANETGWWNTYELHVSPSTGEAKGDVFYFNGSGIPGGSDCEREATYLVKYNASFKVKGGGMLTFKIHDQNCKGQQNCGQNPDGSSACAPRTVDLSGMVAKPPASWTQPPSNSTYKPQWMLIGVTSVTSP